MGFFFRPFIIFIFLISICICKSFSQSDFRDGFIITNNNDTVKGYINYRGDIANTKTCVFKKTEQGNKIIYEPGNIHSYRFSDSKYYISRTIEIEEKEQTVFLEFLLNGIIDVFYYRDEKGDHYFIDNGTDPIYELKNDETETMVDGKRYLYDSKEYKRLLKYTFHDSPSISRKVDDLNLNHKSLINITSQYHNEVCDYEECIVYEKKVPPVVTTFGPVFSLNMVSLVTKEMNNEYYYLTDSNFGWNAVPSFGVFLKIHSPNFNERLFIQYELTYSKMNFNTSNFYSRPLYAVDFYNDISISQSAIGNELKIKYQSPKGNIRPVYYLGIFANIFFGVEYQRNMESRYPWGEVYETEEYKGYPFSKTDYGIKIGTRLVKTTKKGKEIFLDAGYQRGFGYLEEVNTNNFILTFGYEL